MNEQRATFGRYVSIFAMGSLGIGCGSTTRPVPVAAPSEVPAPVRVIDLTTGVRVEGVFFEANMEPKPAQPTPIRERKVAALGALKGNWKSIQLPKRESCIRSAAGDSLDDFWLMTSHTVLLHVAKGRVKQKLVPACSGYALEELHDLWPELSVSGEAFAFIAQRFTGEGAMPTFVWGNGRRWQCEAYRSDDAPRFAVGLPDASYWWLRGMQIYRNQAQALAIPKEFGDDTGGSAVVKMSVHSRDAVAIEHREALWEFRGFEWSRMPTAPFSLSDWSFDARGELFALGDESLWKAEQEGFVRLNPGYPVDGALVIGKKEDALWVVGNELAHRLSANGMATLEVERAFNHVWAIGEGLVFSDCSEELGEGAVGVFQP